MKKSSKIILCISLAAVLVCSMACTAFAAHVGDINAPRGGDAFNSFKVNGCRFNSGYINNLEFAIENTPAYVNSSTLNEEGFIISEEPVTGDAESWYYVQYESETKRTTGAAVNRVAVVNVNGDVLYGDVLSCVIDDFVGVQPRFGVRMDGSNTRSPELYRFTVTVDVPYTSMITTDNTYDVSGGIHSFVYQCEKIVDSHSMVYPFYSTFNITSGISGQHVDVTLQDVITSDLQWLHENNDVTYASQEVRYYRDMLFEILHDYDEPMQLSFVTECYPYEENVDAAWRFVRDFDREVIVEEVQVRPFDWLVQAGQSALDFQLLPGFTVGHILLVMLAIPILIAALRLLAGG